VGTDRYSNYPERIAVLPKLGGLDDAQLERIVALKPDLILVAPSTRAVDRMIALGLPVLVLRQDSLADVQRVLNLLGHVLFVPERAEQLWKTLQVDINLAVARVPASMRAKRFYFEIDSTLYAAGATSFIGELIGRLGLNNIIPSHLGAFPKLSPEFVLRAQPDVIFASHRNLADMLQRPGWSSLMALKRGHTCGLDAKNSDMLVRPGPRMAEAANFLVSCFIKIARSSQQPHHGDALPLGGA
jgi:iron complex transport system substrate-binding protein